MFPKTLSEKMAGLAPQFLPGTDVLKKTGRQLRIGSSNLQSKISTRLIPARQNGQDKLRHLVNSTLWQLEKLEASLVDSADRTLASVEPRLPDQLPFVQRKTRVWVGNLRDTLARIDDSFQQFCSQTTVVTGVLPIENYDRLTAKEAIVAFSGLSAEEKKAVRQYEANHKNRTSILKNLDGNPQF